MAQAVRHTPADEGAGHPWPDPGRWTFDDYRRLPDDGHRYEVIRGVLYVTPAPTYDHQFALAQLFRALADVVARARSGVVLTAPFDVILPGVATPVQPDVLFISRERQPQPGDPHFEGVPDLIVEVLSPGTSRLDQHVKLGAYEQAGVTEYWIVDPKARSVTVYVLDDTGREYAELGRYAGREQVESALLPSVEIVADGLFPERTE